MKIVRFFAIAVIWALTMIIGRKAFGEEVELYNVVIYLLGGLVVALIASLYESISVKRKRSQKE